MKYLSLLVLLFCSPLLSASNSMVGEWGGSNGNDLSYLTIQAKSQSLYMSYVFIYNNGRKINDNSWAKITLTPVGDCWQASVRGIFLEEASTVTICEQQDYLSWELESPLPYVPKSEILYRINPVDEQ